MLEIAGAKQIGFETDYPPASESVIAGNIAALATFKGMSDTERDAIGRNTAALFTRLSSSSRR